MLWSWLKQHIEQFDVVILHGLWLYNGYSTSKAIRQVRKSKKNAPRFYVMPHGMLDPYFQKASGRKIKALRNWVYWKLIESKVVSTADGLLFTCEEERRLAHKPFSPYHPKKEKVIGLGVEEPPFYTTEMQHDFLETCPELENQPYFLFLSRIHEKKGVDLLVKAYKALLNKVEKYKPQVMAEVPGGSHFPNEYDKVLPKLVIAGPGLETPYGQYIQQLVASSKELKKSIIFPGMLSGNAKWGAFYGCEAFVLPSHQENFGIAVVEALACGKPVLISNQVNIWREIKEEGGGLIGKDSQSDTFTLLEKWLSLSSQEKQLLSRQARRTYENYFAGKASITKLAKALYADQE